MHWNNIGSWLEGKRQRLSSFFNSFSLAGSLHKPRLGPEAVLRPHSAPRHLRAVFRRQLQRHPEEISQHGSPSVWLPLTDTRAQVYTRRTEKEEIGLRPAVPSGAIRLIGLVIGGGGMLDHCAVPTCSVCASQPQPSRVGAAFIVCCKTKQKTKKKRPAMCTWKDV